MSLVEKHTPHRFIEQKVFQRPLSPQELEFWKKSPPKKIIFTSSSVRKGVMWMFLHSGFAFPGSESFALHPARALGEYGVEADIAEVSQKPLSFHEYLDAVIPNGDGAMNLDEEVFLGFFQGVPVYMVRSEGETKDNESALGEAWNKVNWVQQRYADQDVIFFSTDTISGLSTSSEKLGKPSNRQDFPPRSDAAAVANYLQTYKDTFYPPGTEIEHISGTVVVRSRAGVIHPSEQFENEVHLLASVSEEGFAQIVVSADAGAGGVLQQLFDWEEERLLDQISSAAMREALADEDTYPADMRAWLLYCHIAGVPYWLVQQGIAQVAAAAVQQQGAE